MSELPTGIERREFLFMRAENLEDLIRRIYGASLGIVEAIALGPEKNEK